MSSDKYAALRWFPSSWRPARCCNFALKAKESISNICLQCTSLCPAHKPIKMLTKGRNCVCRIPGTLARHSRVCTAGRRLCCSHVYHRCAILPAAPDLDPASAIAACDANPPPLAEAIRHEVLQSLRDMHVCVYTEPVAVMPQALRTSVRIASLALIVGPSHAALQMLRRALLKVWMLFRLCSSVLASVFACYRALYREPSTAQQQSGAPCLCARCPSSMPR